MCRENQHNEKYIYLLLYRGMDDTNKSLIHIFCVNQTRYIENHFLDGRKDSSAAVRLEFEFNCDKSVT